MRTGRLKGSRGGIPVYAKESFKCTVVEPYDGSADDCPRVESRTAPRRQCRDMQTSLPSLPTAVQAGQPAEISGDAAAVESFLADLLATADAALEEDLHEDDVRSLLRSYGFSSTKIERALAFCYSTDDKVLILSVQALGAYVPCASYSLVYFRAGLC